LAVLLAGAAAAFPAAQTPIAPRLTPRPNVLLIVADDLGPANIGAYGESTTAPPTPNLDALARRGVLFRAAYANPVCSPSRACVQTGRYAFRTGVGHSIGIPPTPSLPLTERTLPRVLDDSAAGYRHALIGKWHLGDAGNHGPWAPNAAGWAHFAGLEHGAVANYFAWPRTVNGAVSMSSTYATTRMVDDALAWIRTARAPWLCTVNLVAPHGPFHVPPASLHSYNLSGLDPRTQPVPFYKAAIQALDAEVGRLLRGLGASLDATNVIFTSDNGTPREVVEGPWNPLRAKGTTYEGGIRVPCIAAGPDVSPGGRQSAALLHAVDLFATICDWAGCWRGRSADDRTCDGVSFAPFLRSPAAPAPRTHVYSELFTGPFAATYGMSSLRNARYKIVRYHAPNVWILDELYDLAADPLETQNLAGPRMTPEQFAHYVSLLLRSESLRKSL
jgi:arylsulfatase A-like enzyme